MENLRKKAEELFQLKQPEFTEKNEEVRKILHELQVYQIELELQNQELQENSERLKNAERKFYSLFNFSPVAFFLIDKKGIIHDCNLKTVDLLKSEKNHIIKKPVISFIAEGMMTDFFSFLDNTVKTKILNTQEFSFFTKNRNIISVEIIAQQIYEDNVIVAAIDISERKEKDEHLKKALQKAEESDKMKSNFLNMISHEIRTPLNAIIGFSNVLKNERTSYEKKAKCSENITMASKQLLSIIEDILLVSNPNNNFYASKGKDYSINRFLEDLKTEFSEEFKDSQNNYSYNYLENDIEFNTDFAKLKNIIERLVQNAERHTKNEIIEIGAFTDSEKITFFVKDKGCGIDEKTRIKLFEPFEKFETREKFHSGLGLGLAIAKKHSDMLSGKIFHKHNPEGGSFFYLELPLYNSDFAENNFFSLKPVFPEKTVKPVNSKKTILIAEDEILNFQLLQEILADFDLEILHAANGKLAVEMFKKHEPDIILMDFKMPVMDGITATKIIRELNAEIIIIAITAYKIDQKFDTNLFNYILNKPIDIEITLQTIEKFTK